MPADTPRFRLVFFCMGNICRSPTAHGVMRARLQQVGWASVVDVDSAGTHNYHPGKAPDPRSQQHARQRGYDLSDLRARQLKAHDFAQADLLLAMDADNLRLARQQCPPALQSKLQPFTDFCRRHTAHEVPDPYYGGGAGFEHVLDLIEDGCDGLLHHLSQHLKLPLP